LCDNLGIRYRHVEHRRAAVSFQVVSNTDLVIVIASSTMIILALVSGRENIVKRSHGVLFVGLYLVYLTYVVHRG